MKTEKSQKTKKMSEGHPKKKIKINKMILSHFEEPRNTIPIKIAFATLMLGGMLLIIIGASVDISEVGDFGQWYFLGSS